MNTQWHLASQKASQSLKWYDFIGFAILALGALSAVIAWLIFDGSKAL